MIDSFDGGNATVQSNISLLWRLMNAISPAPVNSAFHKMHKLDKKSWIQSFKSEEKSMTIKQSHAHRRNGFLMQAVALIFHLEMTVNYYLHDWLSVFIFTNVALCVLWDPN